MRGFRTCLLAAVAALAVVHPAGAATYDWTFTVDSVSDGFAGLPTYLNEVLGSGTLTTSTTAVDGTYDDGFGNLLADRTYAVTGITGSIAGFEIAGLGASDAWASDNALAFVDGLGWALAPTGTLVLDLKRPVDGGYQVALSADNFLFGGFVDTARGNEWQGGLSLTLVPETAAASEAPLPPPGATAGGAMVMLAGAAVALRRRAQTQR